MNDKIKILYYLALIRKDWDYLENLNKDGLITYFIKLLDEVSDVVSDNENKKMMKYISKNLKSVL